MGESYTSNNVYKLGSNNVEKDGRKILYSLSINHGSKILFNKNCFKVKYILEMFYERCYETISTSKGTVLDTDSRILFLKGCWCSE